MFDDLNSFIRKSPTIWYHWYSATQPCNHTTRMTFDLWSEGTGQYWVTAVDVDETYICLCIHENVWYCVHCVHVHYPLFAIIRLTIRYTADSRLGNGGVYLPSHYIRAQRHFILASLFLSSSSTFRAPATILERRPIRSLWLNIARDYAYRKFV